MRPYDLSIAARSISRQPGFAVVSVLILALGAGANAAVFSVVRGVLFKDLPYPSPEELVAVWPRSFVSSQQIDAIRERARSLTSIAAQSGGWMMALVAEGGEPLKITGAKVSDN